MAKYMLLIKSGDYSGISADEMGSVVEKFMAWSRSVREQGYDISGDELESNRIMVRNKSGQSTVTESLSTEADDIVGGYFILEAPDDATATKIASGCPHLSYDGEVELRAIIER